MELEGVEPSSKQGTATLSTCLFRPSFSCYGKTRTTNHCLILLDFGFGARPSNPIPDIFAPPVPSASMNRAMGRCLVSAPSAEMKLTYYTSVKQRERSYFRQLNVSDRDYRACPQRSACLHSHSTCCQNQTAPMTSN